MQPLLDLRIKSIIPLVVVFEMAMIAVLFFCATQLSQLETKKGMAEQERFEMMLYADRLRQSSDDLTRFARTYVVTGEEQYKTNYFKTLDIRNGEAPRPKNYQGIYWDLLPKDREARHPDTEKISLKDLMAKLPYSQEELDLLSTSENNSNDLVNLEVEAFNLMLGLYKNSEGAYSVQGQPNQQRAIELLHSPEYHNAKHKIMLPIDDFISVLDQRTANKVAMLHHETQQQFQVLFFLMIFFLLGNCLVMLALTKKILNPILYLGEVLKQFADGQKPQKAEHYQDEFGNLIAKFFELQATIELREIELQKSEEEYRLIIESAIEAVISIDMEGNVVRWNPQAVQIFGWSQEEAMGIQLSELIIPVKYRNLHDSGLMRFKETNQGNVLNQILELSALKKDGTEFPIELSIIRPVQNSKSEDHITAFIRDISVRKKAEADLQNALAEVKQAYDELKTTKIQLAESEKVAAMTKTFEKFVPKQFLERIASGGIETIEVGSVTSDQITILFSDIRSFTSISEVMSPEEVFQFLNEYLARMNAPIQKYNGFVDKFIGDAIMALFDQSTESDVKEAEDAVHAAIEMQKELQVFNQERRQQGAHTISIGVGIHSGPVTIGTLGSEQRMDSTAIGDAVNLAARLEGLTKYYNCPIIISSSTFRLLREETHFLWRELDFVSVKGKEQPVSIFEIFDCDPEEIRNLKQDILKPYHEGLLKFHAHQWVEAEKLFEECLNRYPGDVVSRMYVDRCLNFQHTPPPADWNGALLLDQK